MTTVTISRELEERKAFEQWYATHAFNYSRDPIGSRDCSLQWVAWKARAALNAQPAQPEQSRFNAEHERIQWGVKTYGPLLKAAINLIAAVETQHDKPSPLKYTIPYGAVNDLRAAITGTPYTPQAQPEQGERAAEMFDAVVSWCESNGIPLEPNQIDSLVSTLLQSSQPEPAGELPPLAELEDTNLWDLLVVWGSEPAGDRSATIADKVDELIHKLMQDYARAAIAPLQAEIKRLKTSWSTMAKVAKQTADLNDSLALERDQAIAQSKVPAGEVVAWRYRFPTGGRWHYTEHGKNEYSKPQLTWEPLYARAGIAPLHAEMIGMESANMHLSALVDELSSSLQNMFDAFKFDGMGHEYKDGEVPIIDRARELLGMLAAPQAAQPQAPEPCRTLCELCVKRGYNFCANAVVTTPITAQPQVPEIGRAGE